MKPSFHLRFSAVMWVLFVFPSRAQTASEIVSKYLDTVSNGDIRNWDQVKSTYIESVVFYSQGSYDQKISFANSDKPSYSKNYTSFIDKKIKRELYDDSTFSKLNSSFYFLPSGAIILFKNTAPIRRTASAQRDDMDFLPVQIWKLFNKCESLDHLGIKEFSIEKLNCYEIRMVVNDRIYMLYINTTTYLLDYWNNREDHDLTILSGFRNYKRVNGLLLPMTDFMKKNGAIFYQSDIKKIELNPLIDPKIFDYKE
ncbi:MAG TPA: hypothetical protein VL728_20865 [Cyclobacteriaceae bacterium]|jgi:hypothetical protein|nr:hypothetical protein [Cyclobacteriaceae bacterium]